MAAEKDSPVAMGLDVAGLPVGVVASGFELFDVEMLDVVLELGDHTDDDKGVAPDKASR